MSDLQKRKHQRLKDYDYCQNGAYFITFCVKDRREILGKVVVGRGILDAPCVELSEYGKYVIEAIKFLNSRKNQITIDQYIIMPNHVHLIAIIGVLDDSGASGKPRPTNAVIPKLISSIKRFTNKQAGFDMWQTSYHDHIIRNEQEYQEIWRYIYENPIKWEEDKYFNT